MKCSECQEAISSSLDGELDDPAMVNMVQHMSGCGTCRTFMREALLLHRRLQRRATPTVPDRVDERVRAGFRVSGERPTPKSGLRPTSKRTLSLRVPLAAVFLLMLIAGWTIAAVSLLTVSPSAGGTREQIMTLPAVEVHGLFVPEGNDEQHEG